MNICNPSLVINVAGVQKLQTGFWFGKLAAPTGLIPGGTTVIPFADAGTAVGGQGFMTVTIDQITFYKDGILELVALAGLSDPAGAATLGFQFASDGPGSSRCRNGFTQGYATSLYLGPVASGDRTSIIAVTLASGLKIIGGSVSARFDAIS